MSLKLEVGKFYRTRGNWKAKVVADDLDGEWPILVVHYKPIGGTTTTCNLPDGRYPDIDQDYDVYDLIAEWAEPVPINSATQLATQTSSNYPVGPEQTYTIKHMREVVGE